MTVVPSLSMGEAQPVEPGSPSAIEVPRDAELVETALVAVAVDVCRSAHLLLSAGVAICRRRETKLGADVVSGHPHMW